MRALVLGGLLFLALPSVAQATAIAHTFAEQNTKQTNTTTTWQDVLSITSGNFTSGKKYLLHATCNARNSSSNEKVGVRVVHGATPTSFTESEEFHQLVGSLWITYGWLTVWTAVSGEGIKLQFNAPEGLGTAEVDQCFMLSMNLTDDLVENTDWIFNHNSASTALTTTFADFASTGSFTPGTAGHDWLILGYCRFNNNPLSVSAQCRLDRSEEATSTTPEAKVIVTGGATLRNIQPLARCFNLGASANTFKMRAADATSGTQNTHLHSSVFALNLNKFKAHTCAYTDGTVALSGTDYATQIQTLSVSPTLTGNVWIGGAFIFGNDGTDTWKARMQVNNSDQPAGQTTDNYQFAMSAGSTDKDPFITSTIVSLAAGSQTVDFDASSAATLNASNRQVWAVTMELAAGGGGGGGGSGSPCIIGGRAMDLQLAGPCGVRSR